MKPHRIAARAAEDIGKIQTRERLRLLRGIRERAPESIRELAGMLERRGAHVKKPQRAQRTQRKK